MKSAALLGGLVLAACARATVADEMPADCGRAGAFAVSEARVSEEHARRVLTDYVYGPQYTASRAPRGLPAAAVARFVRDEPKPGAEARAFERVLELLRFYECPEGVDTMLRVPDPTADDAEALERVAHGLRAAGEIGGPTERRAAARRFDALLASFPGEIEAWTLMLDVFVALAPDVTGDAVDAGLERQRAMALRSQADPLRAQMRDDELLALRANGLVRARRLAAEKQRIASLPPDAQREPLAAIYLGVAEHRDAALSIWAGRRLRRQVGSGGAAGVIAAIETAAARAAEAALDAATLELARVRAAQAVVYLGGALGAAHPLAPWLRAEPAGFLWDDPAPR